MKRVAWILIVLLMVSSLSKAQTTRRPIAANYIGLGAYSLNHIDVFSFTANPAALAQLKNASAGVYGERRFLLSELNNFEAVIGLPTSSGNFGLKSGYFGSGDYNEAQVGLAYGRSLGRKVDIGVTFNYHNVQIPGYGSASTVSFEVGATLHITERLHAGILVDNPVGGRFGKDEQEKLPSLYTIGFGFDASRKFLISAAIEKEEDQPVNVNAGLQYKFLPQLLVRAGIASATSSEWVGLGILFKSLRLDITTSYQPQLGITPGLLLVFNFKRNAN